MFSIPLKFRGKPFMGLAQLSKIFNSKKMQYPKYWLTHLLASLALNPIVCLINVPDFFKAWEYLMATMSL